ncbi:MAG: hypothetical protein KGJ04_01375 [Gammaproteobacteria bacterium]|nr:hypothetical protein [Gammaproteobacteria bacterium]
MLDNVGIVHMNGRIHDPNLGRFLSVDPVFEFPTNTQSLNPYSYVLNNPLSMTDPTGYVVDSCGTDKTSCPASSTMKPGDSAEKTFTPTCSHIEVHVTAGKWSALKSRRMNDRDVPLEERHKPA